MQIWQTRRLWIQFTYGNRGEYTILLSAIFHISDEQNCHIGRGRRHKHRIGRGRARVVPVSCVRVHACVCVRVHVFNNK